MDHLPFITLSYYKHGSEREVFTFEVTTLKAIYREDVVPLPDVSAPSV
jgi:hypothetical protein